MTRRGFLGNSGNQECSWHISVNLGTLAPSWWGFPALSLTQQGLLTIFSQRLIHRWAEPAFSGALWVTPPAHLLPTVLTLKVNVDTYWSSMNQRWTQVFTTVSRVVMMNLEFERLCQNMSRMQSELQIMALFQQPNRPETSQAVIFGNKRTTSWNAYLRIDCILNPNSDWVARGSTNPHSEAAEL